MTQCFHCLEAIPREHIHKPTDLADGSAVCASGNWKPPRCPSRGDELNDACSAAQRNPYFSTWLSNRHLKGSMARDKVLPWLPKLFLSHPPMGETGLTNHPAASAKPCSRPGFLSPSSTHPTQRHTWQRDHSSTNQHLLSSKPSYDLLNGLTHFYSGPVTAISQESSESNNFYCTYLFNPHSRTFFHCFEKGSERETSISRLLYTPELGIKPST